MSENLENVTNSVEKNVSDVTEGNIVENKVYI